MELYKPPFPKWYDPNGHCDYNYGAQGHTIENCLPLKYKVQSLIKACLLCFNRNNRPSVMANLLPNHIGLVVSAIMEDSCIKIKTKVDEIKSSMDEVYYVMVKMRVIPKKEIFVKENEQRCYFCHATGTDHTIIECGDFRNLLQEMMD